MFSGEMYQHSVEYLRKKNIGGEKLARTVKEIIKTNEVLRYRTSWQIVHEFDLYWLHQDYDTN